MLLSTFQLAVRFLVKPYYQEAHRFHHSWDHIETMLDGYEKFFGNVMSEEEYLAILYHDIVYQPWSARNEEDSIEMLRLHYNIHFPKQEFELIAKAIGIIRDTKHDGHAPTFWSQRVVDLDLMILGKNEKAYERYKNNTRREYIRYSDLEWNRGRSSVLQSLLDQPRIFSTQEMYDAFELKARDNIQKELDECNKYLLMV